MRVCEIYPAPQGEGPTTGVPSLFVRLSGCNLHCGWCDSFFTWNFEGTKFKNEGDFNFPKVKRGEEMREVGIEDFRREVLDEARASHVKNIVLTGGEPMLQQKALVAALWPLKTLGFTFEVETNGTIVLEDETFALVDRINCSPKLANSGNEEILRFRLPALKRIVSHPGSVFKFVLSGANCVAEIQKIVQESGMPNDRVLIMPEGVTRDSQIVGFKLAEDIALTFGWRVCPRVHILIHGTKRAV